MSQTTLIDQKLKLVDEEADNKKTFAGLSQRIGFSAFNV